MRIRGPIRSTIELDQVVLSQNKRFRTDTEVEINGTTMKNILHREFGGQKVELADNILTVVL